MRLIDRLVYKEIVGPWMFGVGLFTALIMAGMYMGRLAEYLNDQVPAGLVLELTGLYMPAILVKTFSMAMLLAALLAFGRLSSDSEIIALRAGGASVARIVRPVMVFSLAVVAVTFWVNEQVVPGATMRSSALAEQIAKTMNPTAPEPHAITLVKDYRLYGFVCAEDVSPATRTLTGVTVIAYDRDGKRGFTLYAKQIENLDESDMTSWRIRGGATIASADFLTVVNVPSGIWPTRIPMPDRPANEIAKSGPTDFDAMSIAQMRDRIAEGRRKKTMMPGTTANWEYQLWSKVTVPLAALVFGILGAVLGIRNQRTGTSTGFAISIAIIFGYVTLANVMNVWAKSGVFPAYVAAFTPLVLGMAVALTIMWRRNL